MFFTFDIERLVKKIEQKPICQLSVKDILALIDSINVLNKELQDSQSRLTSQHVRYDDRYTDKIPVGENIKYTRERRKLTLGELAEKTGVSKAYLSQIELGQRYPSLNKLKKIAMTFEIPTIELLAVQE